MTVLGLIGAVTVVLLAAGAIALIHHATHAARRVPPARPRATFREALDQAGDEVDQTVFPPRRGGPGLRT